MLTEDNSTAVYRIQAYTDHTLLINGVCYTHSLILTPDNLLATWSATDAHSLTTEQLQQLLDCQPEIILLGTGKNSIILPDASLAPLYTQQFQVECMSTAAACRTFTILAAEGRKVVAGLIL